MPYDVEVVRQRAKSLSNKAGSWVGMALQPGVEYVLLVGTNNPPAKVRARKDVKGALAHAASGARAKAVPLLQESWNTGVRFGHALAAEQAKQLGLGALPSPTISTKILESLSADIERILADAPQDMLNSYARGGEDGLVKAQKRAAYRVSLAVEAALKHAQDECQRQIFKDTGTLKQWEVRSATPCSHCLYLSKLPPIPWDEEFPAEVAGLRPLGVYAKGLYGPPRHPNCMCGLRAVRPRKRR